MYDSRNQKPNDHIPILDPVTTSDYNYNTYKHPKNRPKSDVESVHFRVQESLDFDDESGVSSPPLWKNSQPRSPNQTPLHNSRNYRSISLNSRALAIAKGQWELMEIVKNMPESSYELSLKDLVEKNGVLESDQELCLINKEEEIFTDDQEQVLQQRVKSIKKTAESITTSTSSSNSKKRGKIVRSENRGLFLKLCFPISLESEKKQMKNSSKTTTSTTKVSPKPVESSDKSSKNMEKDWWKRRFSCSSESDSSKTGSSNSESSGSNYSNNTDSRRKNTNRKKKGFLANLWSRSCFGKSKSAE